VGNEGEITDCERKENSLKIEQREREREREREECWKIESGLYTIVSERKSITDSTRIFQ